MPNFLWGFSNDNTGAGGMAQNVVALPTIKASNAASTVSTRSNTTPSQINVVRDFYWTYSKLGEGRQEVPRIILTERKLRTNALVSQLKYSLGQATGGVAQTLQNISTFADDNNYPGVAKFVTGLQESVSQIPGGVDAFAAKFTNNYGNDRNPTVNSSYWLEPYRNLYLTDPTGWVYILPYFDNNHTNQSNAFSESGKVGGIGDVAAPYIGMVTEAAEVAASINNPTQITYIEKTKFYMYPTEGEDINVEFPLINTGSVTYDDVVRNWQFLYLLVYQNRPGKTSQNTVDQPVIYQVEVPGIKFFPFCYVTAITVDFMGSRREMDINVPTTTTSSSTLGDIAGQFLGSSSGSTTIKAVIPDAYRVRISLKSMTANTKNFMQHMISSHKLIETGTSSNSNILNNIIPNVGNNFGLGSGPSSPNPFTGTGLGPLA
jgi:hypothetical protein